MLPLKPLLDLHFREFSMLREEIVIEPHCVKCCKIKILYKSWEIKVKEMHIKKNVDNKIP